MKMFLQFSWLVAVSIAIAVGLNLIFHATASVFAVAFGVVFSGYGFIVKAPQKAIEQTMMWFAGE
jgi:hypothetical protein